MFRERDHAGWSRVSRQVHCRTKLSCKRIHLQAGIVQQRQNRRWFLSIRLTKSLSKMLQLIQALGSRLRGLTGEQRMANGLEKLSGNFEISIENFTFGRECGFTLYASAQPAQHEKTEPHAFRLTEQEPITFRFDGVALAKPRDGLLRLSALRAGGWGFGGVNRGSRCP
jgi:hypothetical protein